MAPQVYSIEASSSLHHQPTPTWPRPSEPPRKGILPVGKGPTAVQRRLSPAGRARRLLPWVMLLLAGASMVYQAVLEVPPVNRPRQRARPALAWVPGMSSYLRSDSQRSSGLFFPELLHHFTQLPQGSASACGKALGTPKAYISLQRALQACLGHPSCTAVSTSPDAGPAVLCSGLAKRGEGPSKAAAETGSVASSGSGGGVTSSSDGAAGGKNDAGAGGKSVAGAGGSTQGGAQVVFVRKGCQNYTAADAEGDSLVGALPQCLTRDSQAVLAAAEGVGGAAAGLCPLGQTPVVSNEWGMACDVCGPAGYCGGLKEAQLVPGFDEVLQSYVESTLGAQEPNYLYRAFNPSLVTVEGRVWAVTRVSNATNCFSEEVPRLPSQTSGDSTYIDNHVLLCPLVSSSMLPLKKECRYVSVDMGSMASAVPGLVSSDIRGMEDARAFELGGRLHLLSFFYTLNDTRHKPNVWQRSRLRWFMPESGRRSWMFVARLEKGLTSADKLTPILCPELHDKIHKNWMPLIMGGTLYFVTHAQPLTVIKPDLETGTCQLFSRETALGVVSSLEAAREAKGSGDAAFAAVLGGAHLHGGAPFIEVAPDRFLSIVHHGRDYAHGRIYTHHFQIVQPAPEGGFETAWLSEAFRLPEPPPRTPSSPLCSNIQFSSGLLKIGNTLYLSFGTKDCHAQLARLPDATAQLQRWLERGMGTQRGGPELTHGRPVVKLEGSVFGWDQGPFEVAAGMVSSWIRQGRNASADIYMRHVRLLDDWTPNTRDLPEAGVEWSHFVDNNILNNMPTTVAITHGRLSEVMPAAAAAWIPYVTWEGAVNASQLSVLTQRASELWVPTSFHRAALERMGVGSSKVQVMPPAVTPAMLCPAGLAGSSRPHTLVEAKAFIFLHRAPPSSRNGALLVLEAYREAFSSEDDVTLVLHVPGTKGDGIIEDLQSKVGQLKQDPSAPHVLLFNKHLSFGRQADKVLASADALVQPYLSGEPLWKDLIMGMSCGKPLITTEAGPAAELAAGDAGYLVDSRWGPCHEGNGMLHSMDGSTGGGSQEAGEATGERLHQQQEEQVPGRKTALERQGAGEVGQIGASDSSSDGSRKRTPPTSGEVCLELDPSALAAVLQSVHSGGAAECRRKGAAAAEVAKALAVRLGQDAVASKAWERVNAQIKVHWGGNLAAMTNGQQHRKEVAST